MRLVIYSQLPVALSENFYVCIEAPKGRGVRDLENMKQFQIQQILIEHLLFGRHGCWPLGDSVNSRNRRPILKVIKKDKTIDQALNYATFINKVWTYWQEWNEYSLGLLGKALQDRKVR